jgi:hypothetical protein
MTLHTQPDQFPHVPAPDLIEPATVFKALLASRGKLQPQLEDPTGKRAGDGETVCKTDSPTAERGRINVAVATNGKDVEEAVGLVRERYQWRGYSADHVTPQRPDPSRRSFTLLAKSGETTVGTMTLGLDGPRGLMIDEGYPDEIQRARLEGRRVCELTRLALAEQIDTKVVLSSLFGVAYALGRALHDVTDVFIEVNPRHVVFYRRVLGFVVAAGERFCERVNAPSVLLCLELSMLDNRLFDTLAATRQVSEFAMA